MDSKAIARRLDALQHTVDANKPAVIVVTMTTGEKITTDILGSLEFVGSDAAADKVSTDDPRYKGWAELLTVLLHPVPNREVRDFE